MKVLFVLVSFITIVSASASQYPSSFYDQIARFRVEGPVVFGSVQSGAGSHGVILGYKDSGVLGNRDYVDAVINFNCISKYHHRFRTTKVFRLQREMHGNGYLSAPLEYLSRNCPSGHVEGYSIAFASNGEWDSKYGQNYNFSGHFGHQSYNHYYRTGAAGHNIEFQIWDYIIDLMR